MAEVSEIPAPNDKIAKRNILVLIIIQATIGAMIPMHFMLGGLAGKLVAPSPAWATMPISLTIIGGMIATGVNSRVMIRHGRVNGFVMATLISVLGLILAAYGIHSAQFWILCFGSLLLGFYMSAQGLFRFAATDMASPSFTSRAISLTLIGGIFSAFLGPELASRFSIPQMWLPYAITAGLALVATGFYYLLVLPAPPKQTRKNKLPVRDIFRDRSVLAAMVISISAYAMMNLMMTSTPLAVEGCGFTRQEASNVVRAHVLAMFVPSFFTGYIIRWIGLRIVVITGIVILIAAGLVALSGVSLNQFYVALILLGLGWNFSFIGGTNMLSLALAGREDAKQVQGINDTIMWSFVALASLSSGVLMNSLGDGGAGGWFLVNSALLVVLGLALILGLWLSRSE